MKHIKNYVRATKAIEKFYKAKIREDKADCKLVDKWEKEKLAQLALLDLADKAPKLNSIAFRVNWKHSRTDGGLRPYAEAFVNSHFCGCAYAGGGGYDKLSTACNKALKLDMNHNGINAIITRWILENWTFLEEFYAIEKGGKWHALPLLEFSGKGMSTLDSIFYRMGWKVTNFSVPRADYIEYTRR